MSHARPVRKVSTCNPSKGSRLTPVQTFNQVVDLSIPCGPHPTCVCRTIYFRDMTHMDADQKRVWRLKMLGIAIGIISSNFGLEMETALRQT